MNSLFPPLPPAPCGSEEDLLAALKLTLVDGIGPRTQQLLLDECGSPQEVFDATPERLREIDGIGPKLVA